MRKEIVQKFVESLDHPIDSLGRDAAEKSAALAEEMINCFGFPTEDVVKELMAKQDVRENFLAIAYLWILHLSVLKDWQYDGRNEAAVRMSRKFINGNSKFGVETDVLPVSTTYFVAKAEKWHRTLQQTFAKLTFRFVDQYVTRKYTEAEGLVEAVWTMHHEQGAYWWRLPMI